MTKAIELYVRAGWQDFSIDEVARRAGVGKASIYLRWKDKADLLFDALGAAYKPWDLKPSGALRQDLEALVVAIIAELSIDVGWAINRAQTDPGMPPRLQTLCQALVNARLEVIASLIGTAKARGEIPADAPGDLITATVTGAALGYAGLFLFAGHEAEPGGAEAYARRLVDFLYPALTRDMIEKAL
ncbi:MAG TPA: TetR/AcrR family transcriptional regulator [Devosia sp.]|nr:TetR/AcrR family transcriptional regulator [Devosia sp.]